MIDERPHASPAFFEALRGSIAGALELTGVKDLKVVSVDEGKPSRCVFHATWG